MDIDVFSRQELPAVLRVLRTALRTEGALQPRERLFLDTYARIAGCDRPRADPDPIDLRELTLAGAHQRKRLLQLAAIAVLLGRPVRPTSFQFLRSLSRHLDTHDPVIEVITALLQGQQLKVRLLTMRRGLRVMLREARQAEGAMGMLRLLAAMWLRAPVNRDRLWNYKRLGLLPEGTLGREYWAHMTRTGFGFPGEPGGIPNSLAYHDIAHVLAGHDTTPQGEIQQGCLQGGNRREDGFFFIQFALLQFHQGVRITPAAPPETGHFDPEKVLWAIHRGARCAVDFTHQWDYWPLMAQPLEQARARCALLPHLPPASALRRVA